jgi:hypothetical protein
MNNIHNVTGNFVTLKKLLRETHDIGRGLLLIYIVALKEDC